MHNFVLAAEAAEILGISLYQVYQRMRRGDLPYRFNGRTCVIDRDDVEGLKTRIVHPYSPTLRPPQVESSLSVAETSRLTGLPPTTIRKLCYTGVLGYRRADGQTSYLHIDRRSVERYIASYTD